MIEKEKPRRSGQQMGLGASLVLNIEKNGYVADLSFNTNYSF